MSEGSFSWKVFIIRAAAFIISALLFFLALFLRSFLKFLGRAYRSGQIDSLTPSYVTVGIFAALLLLIYVINWITDRIVRKIQAPGQSGKKGGSQISLEKGSGGQPDARRSNPRGLLR